MGEKNKDGMEIKKVLPDTNFLILGLVGQEPYALLLKQLIIDNRLVFSPIVIAEFLCGGIEEEGKAFLKLVEKFPILSVDLAIAKLAAICRKKYLKRKKKLILPDCLIAATCKIHNAVLVTLDKKNYPIKEIEIVNKF